MGTPMWYNMACVHSSTILRSSRKLRSVPACCTAVAFCSAVSTNAMSKPKRLKRYRTKAKMLKRYRTESLT